MSRWQPQSKLERFMAKVSPQDSGCWHWTAQIDKKTVYGRLNIEWAHRVSYELLVGPIPDGLHIDHLCRNRPCVNPKHLEPVTSRTNTLRGNNHWAVVARTNRCSRGHEYTPENTYLRPDGNGRQCRICIQIRSRRQVQRKSAARRIAREEAA